MWVGGQGAGGGQREQKNQHASSYFYIFVHCYTVYFSQCHGKNSLRNNLRNIGSKFVKVETARQATSAIEAENNEGLDKAAALCCKEPILGSFSALSYLFQC